RPPAAPGAATAARAGRPARPAAGPARAITGAADDVAGVPGPLQRSGDRGPGREPVQRLVRRVAAGRGLVGQPPQLGDGPCRELFQRLLVTVGEGRDELVSDRLGPL